MDVVLPPKIKFLFTVFGLLIIVSITVLFFDTLVQRDFYIENDLESEVTIET